MKIQTFSVGMFFVNCYLVNEADSKEAFIIDPGFDDRTEAEEIIQVIEKNRFTVKNIINTHGHPDHTCGNGLVKHLLNAPITIHKNDAYMIGTLGKQLAQVFNLKNHSPPADILLNEGDTLKLGKEELKVIHTPGHSPGSICLKGNENVFTGDTLFEGSIGRTDFPESSEEQMRNSLQKLKKLADDLNAYPGHGSATTIGKEKRTNPFLTGLP